MINIIRMRINLQHLMIFVVIVAISLAAIKPVLEVAEAVNQWIYSIRHGPNTSVLSKNSKVYNIEDFSFGNIVVPGRTECLVVDDPPDEDSAYNTRFVDVKIIKGSQKNTIVKVRRTILRVKW